MKVGYIETFPVIGHDRWQKLPLEVDITPDIDFLNATDEEIEKFMLKVRRVQYALKKQVQSFFYESNKAAEKEKFIENIENTEWKSRTPEQRMIDDISTVTDIKVLKDTYTLLSKTYPKIKEAYDNRLKQLTA